MRHFINRLNKIFYKLSRKLFFSLFILIVIIGIFIYVDHQNIYDFIRLYNYHPSSMIVKLSKEDSMTSYTKTLFYVNHPKLLNTVSNFRKYCPEDKKNIVLGCYYVGQRGIFIYNIQTKYLYGVTQVTAAHEVLHAVYARLNHTQRFKLDQELQSFYNHDLNNSRVKDEIKIYQKTEPASVYDEMSCTFGTEVAHLPSNLINYYKRYFYNRAAIISFEHDYQAAFTNRQVQINQDNSKLQILKSNISSQTQYLLSLKKQLNSKRAYLNSLRNNNPVQYNQNVAVYNRTIGNYNLKYAGLKKEILGYNSLAIDRNKLANKLDSLDHIINTQVLPSKP